MPRIMAGTAALLTAAADQEWEHPARRAKLSLGRVASVLASPSTGRRPKAGRGVQVQLIGKSVPLTAKEAPWRDITKSGVSVRCQPWKLCNRR